MLEEKNRSHTVSYYFYFTSKIFNEGGDVNIVPSPLLLNKYNLKLTTIPIVILSDGSTKIVKTIKFGNVINEIQELTEKFIDDLLTNALEKSKYSVIYTLIISPSFCLDFDDCECQKGRYNTFIRGLRYE